MSRLTDAITRCLASAALLATLLPVPIAGAETSFTGGPDALRVEARDVAVEEVLAGLGASFGLHYRSDVSLSRRITGTYKGSLPRVVARLLDGYDFVIVTSPRGVEVRVYGGRNAEEADGAAKAAEAAALPSPKQTPSTARARRDARQKRSAN